MTSRTEAMSEEMQPNANGQVNDQPRPPKKRSKYRHIAAYHSKSQASSLSREADVLPNFLGFRNLMVLYGVLICIKCHDYRRQDLVLGSILFASVPCHLLVAYIIELSAATAAKRTVGRQKKTEEEKERDQKVFQSTWPLTAFLHTLNATLCLAVTSFVVWFYIHHPGIGTICQLHAIIVWLKNCSYAFTNRDLRLAMLNPAADPGLPEIYSSCPYPRNITIKNLGYFWLAPTLVYQPVYPRTPSIRWSFVAKRLAEFVGLAMFIWLLSAQYAAPVLRNSIEKIAVMDIASILERVMKLSTISLIIWLAGFFALFQALLNALAEVMQFGDREFYLDWWNSSSLGAYWRTWNRPVYLFMKRHVFSPLVGRGWSPLAASGMVFTLSAILHEMLVGIPTHNFIGVAFFGMMFQLPLIALTTPLEKMRGPSGKVIGNCIFWVSFCLVGQPLGALLYFFAWQAKYGSQLRVSYSQFHPQLQLTLPSAVIGVALGAIPVLGFVHGIVTSSLRKQAKVPYPNSYASMELAKENAKAEQFNCAQRAHSNFLENSSQTMLFTLVAGLKYPEYAAGLGALWVFFRVLFLYGYVYSGKAQGKGRMIGSFFLLVQGALWGLSVFGVGGSLLST
ncbi:unnamed protein product [Penicillium olsonii]|nr:unnamed protein product [Penicillium olsonii]